MTDGVNFINDHAEAMPPGAIFRVPAIMSRSESEILPPAPSFTTGHIGIVNGVVTLTGAYWPQWAVDGTLIVGSAVYVVTERTDETLTLSDATVNVNAPSPYTLKPPSLAPFSEQTIEISNGIVSLPVGGLWPWWAAYGRLAFNSSIVDVETRFSDRQLILSSTPTAVNVPSGTEYVLYPPDLHRYLSATRPDGSWGTHYVNGVTGVGSKAFGKGRQLSAPGLIVAYNLKVSSVEADEKPKIGELWGITTDRTLDRWKATYGGPGFVVIGEPYEGFVPVRSVEGLQLFGQAQNNIAQGDSGTIAVYTGAPKLQGNVATNVAVGDEYATGQTIEAYNRWANIESGSPVEFGTTFGTTGWQIKILC